METLKGQSANWKDSDFVTATQEPGVSVSAMSPELPSVTIATIIGVTMLVLITIAGVFLLGVLFDCRQQRILDEKMDEVKRLRIQRRAKPEVEEDTRGIAAGMEETAQSIAPAEILKQSTSGMPHQSMYYPHPITLVPSSDTCKSSFCRYSDGD